MTWSTVCSSAPHSQAAEEAISHLYKQGRKRPTPARRRLSRTQALFGGSFGGDVYRSLELKCGVLWGCPPTPRTIDARCAACILLLSEKLMSCCAAGTNGCLDLRRRATALDGRLNAEWSRWPGSMTRRPKVSVVPLRRSSAGWMTASVGRLSADVGRRHPVTIRKASLMTWSMRRVWALWHQIGAQYSAVEMTRTRVAVRKVVAPPLQP